MDLAPTRIASPSPHLDHHIPLLAAALRVAVRLGGLRQGVAAINDNLELAGLDEFFSYNFV